MQSLVILVFLGVLPPASLSESCPDPSSSTDSFQKLPFDDVVVTQDALHTVKMRSDLDCGLQCARAEGCVMFTCLPGQNAPSGDCQLYGQLPSSTVGQEASPGARSYAVNDPCGDGYSLKCDRCLRLLDGKMTYQEANQTCQQLGQGRLVMTKTRDTLMCAVCFLEHKGVTDHKMWVGADDLQQGGQYIWNDGTLLHSNNTELWADNQPDNRLGVEHCALFDQAKQAMNDGNCDLKRYVLCEKDL